MRRPPLLLAAVLAVGAVMVPNAAGAQTTPDTTVPTTDTTAATTSTTTAPPPSTTTPPLPPTTTSTTAAPPTTTAPPVAAPVPTEGGSTAPKVKGVGDSVFHSAESKVLTRLRPEYRPRFRSVLGATIADMTPSAQTMAANQPAAMVLALGNPDMALVDGQNPPDVYGDAEHLLDITAAVPCVVWVNLKQRGVNGYYNQHWATAAARFDQWLVGAASSGGGLHYANLHVLDWNAATIGHPSWFLADGLHLNEVGQANYARKIDRFLNRVCPP